MPPKENQETIKIMNKIFLSFLCGVRMTTKNLKKHLSDNGYTKDNEPFDLSIYDSNKVCFILTTNYEKV